MAEETWFVWLSMRREYSIYPDFLYKPGRRKVLQHFLNMARIFKTEEFAVKFEEPSRLNLKRKHTTNYIFPPI